MAIENELPPRVYHPFVLSLGWHWLGGLAVFLSPFFFLYPVLRWGATGSVLLVVLFLAGAVWLVRTYRLWMESELVLTNTKLVHINQHGFFDRSVSQVFLNRINDVSYRRQGLWQTWFNYGTVSIQVSASPEKLYIKNVRQPELVQQAIYDAQEQFSERGPDEYSEAELLAVIREIRSRVGEARWRQILQGDWKLKQELIDEVGEADKEKAEAIEQFFSRKI